MPKTISNDSVSSFSSITVNSINSISSSLVIDSPNGITLSGNSILQATPGQDLNLKSSVGNDIVSYQSIIPSSASVHSLGRSSTNLSWLKTCSYKQATVKVDEYYSDASRSGVVLAIGEQFVTLLPASIPNALYSNGTTLCPPRPGRYFMTSRFGVTNSTGLPGNEYDMKFVVYKTSAPTGVITASLPAQVLDTAGRAWYQGNNTIMTYPGGNSDIRISMTMPSSDHVDYAYVIMSICALSFTY